ncbi:MAG: hypothetical protein KF901_30820 [Myxococcales bacterium]|nr:hypothetical protein [Myxococcales bacterium]
MASLVVGVALVAAGGTAHANPEPPGSYDARVTGMAGVAVASVDSPAALLHNPAQLDQIERFSVTAVATSLLVNLRAPFAGPGTEQNSGLIYAPLLFLGGVGRVHERVSVGLGAYVLTGFGGGFPAVDCISYGDPSECTGDRATDRPRGVSYETPIEQSVTLFVAEIAVPIQVTVIPDVLSLGVTLRLPYGRQAVNAVQQEPIAGGWSQADQNLHGFGIPGVLLGVSYRPIPGLTLAASYRSKVWVNMSGQTTIPSPFGMGDPIEIPTTTRWYVPHTIRGGVAYTTWRNRLTVAAELRIQLHAEANATQRFELSPNDRLLASLVPDTVAQFRWRNVYIGGLASELWVLPRMTVRLGGTVGNSASNSATMTPFSPPPGLQFSVFGGLGVRAGPLDVDLGLGWGGGAPHRRTENDPELCSSVHPSESERPRYQAGRPPTLTASGGCAGEYHVSSFFVSLSVTYRMGARTNDAGIPARSALVTEEEPESEAHRDAEPVDAGEVLVPDHDLVEEPAAEDPAGEDRDERAANLSEE